MPDRWIYSLVSVIVVSLISLVGVLTLTINVQRFRQVIFILVSLSAGAMFGDVFIHLLPEAYQEKERAGEVAVSVLLGIMAFFVLEKFVRWRHAHTLEADNGIQPVGYTNLFVDGAHNLLDGLLIGASYAVSL